MSEGVADQAPALGPRWGRVVLLFVGAFVTAGIPVLLGLALGKADDDLVIVILPIVAVYSVLWLAAIFKVGTWAAQILPPAGVEPVPAQELRRRLLSLNDLAAPFSIREDVKGQLIAEWRLADARWTGLMESGRLSIAHSVRMRIDSRRRQVRATDFQKRVEWRGGVALHRWFGSFSFFRGIVFSEYAAGVEYGLLWKDGRWQCAQAYAYSFSLDEMKQPLLRTAVAAGWTWQPVVFR